MLDFFSACVRLFNGTFQASMSLGFFQLLGGYLVFRCAVSFFVMMLRGTKRM